MDQNFRILMEQASRETLENLIANWADRNSQFYGECMAQLGASAEQLLPILKNNVRDAIRENTYRGSISWKSCDQICYEIDDAVDKTAHWAEEGHALSEIKFLCWAFQISMKLASTADSSSGSLTMTVETIQGQLTQCLDLLSRTAGKSECRAAFTEVMKLAKNDVFDGWTDWRCEVLIASSLVASPASAQKLYDFLDVLEQKSASSPWSADVLTVARYHIMCQLEDSQTASAYLMSHRENNELRRIAVQNAIASGDYRQAEALCLEKLQDAQHFQGTQWNELLYRIYGLWGRREQQIERAKCLFFSGKSEYYDSLKTMLVQDGRWEAEYPALRDQSARQLSVCTYAELLSKENELVRLMDIVEQHPFLISQFGEQLAPFYKDKVRELYAGEVRLKAQQSNCRKDYAHVCRYIDTMAHDVGWEEARPVLDELVKTYPKRPALLDELHSLQNRWEK